MKKIFALLPLLAFCAVLLAPPAVRADDKSDAVRMVHTAASYLKANGMEKALDAVNDPAGEFVKGELYVFAFDLSGILLANATKPAMVGQNLLDVPDSAGKRFRREFIDLALKSGSGWVDYRILNPKSKEIEAKTSYIEKAGDLVFGCGIYKK